MPEVAEIILEAMEAQIRNHYHRSNGIKLSIVNCFCLDKLKRCPLLISVANVPWHYWTKQNQCLAIWTKTWVVWKHRFPIIRIKSFCLLFLFCLVFLPLISGASSLFLTLQMLLVLFSDRTHFFTAWSSIQRKKHFWRTKEKFVLAADIKLM